MPEKNSERSKNMEKLLEVKALTKKYQEESIENKVVDRKCAALS